jgi:MarR family transcriptional regulator, organic hydroperoxide resistance regulator
MTGGISPAADGRRLSPVVETVGLLLELTDHLKARFVAVSATVGLSMAQARTLLRIEGPVSMRELAARTRYDASNMTGIVEGLYARGLVERQTSSADRRVRRIVLTEQGAGLRERLRSELAENVPAIGELTVAERQALHEILRRALDRS